MGRPEKHAPGRAIIDAILYVGELIVDRSARRTGAAGAFHGLWFQLSDERPQDKRFEIKTLVVESVGNSLTDTRQSAANRRMH